MNTQSSSSTNSTTIQYYEHHLAYYRSYYFFTDNSEDIYPHLREDYGLLGYMVVNIDEYGVLVVFSESELSADIGQKIDHELEPDQSIYNVKHNQSLAEFHAWYDTQDAQTQQEYWQGKLSKKKKEAPISYAETVTENAQNALWQGLKVYDEVMGQSCPEDEYDSEANERVQDVTNELIPRLIMVAKILGYEEAAIDVVMELITDYHHHDHYQSHIDEARLTDYDRLYTWLSRYRRTTPFQDVVLTGVVCQFE